jgi:two-component system NtrC family response regulator
VRELRNTIERAMMLSPGPEIDMRHLPEDVINPRQKYAKSQSSGVMCADGENRLQIQLPPEGVTMEGVERELIIMALQQHNYNQTRAAKTLGMSRDTLRYRMKKFDIKEKDNQR